MQAALIALLGNSKALGAFANLIDAAVPVAVSNRTKIAALVCPLLPYIGPLVPPPYSAAVPIVQGLLCSALPVFAAAGLIRSAQVSVAASATK